MFVARSARAPDNVSTPDNVLNAWVTTALPKPPVAKFASLVDSVNPIQAIVKPVWEPFVRNLSLVEAPVDRMTGAAPVALSVRTQPNVAPTALTTNGSLPLRNRN